MKTIVLASNSGHKIKEVSQIMQDYKIVSLKDIGFFDDIVEDGLSFEENALIKARAAHKFLKDNNINAFVIADDSGLCVQALNNEPGIYSARYSGDHNEPKNREKLLNNLKNKTDRSAFFMCAMAVVDPNGNENIFFGKTEGSILTVETGNTSFGYDCLFFSNDLNKCFGLCSDDEKNLVSHRGRALEQVKQFLIKQ